MTFDPNLHIFHFPELPGIVDLAIQFFLGTPVYHLPPTERFIGPGVYALYYAGKFELYSRLTESNQQGWIQPIYIGKAVPEGSRQARARVAKTTGLFQRLLEHARSIQSVKNLDLEDFWCRFMILQGTEADLIVPVEAELIRRYQPLWNTVVSGFGIHAPGSGRYRQKPSEWDVLHQGRVFASKLTGTSPQQDLIIAKIRKHLEPIRISRRPGRQ